MSFRRWSLKKLEGVGRVGEVLGLASTNPAQTPHTNTRARAHARARTHAHHYHHCHHSHTHPTPLYPAPAPFRPSCWRWRARTCWPRRPRRSCAWTSPCSARPRWSRWALFPMTPTIRVCLVLQSVATKRHQDLLKSVLCTLFTQTYLKSGCLALFWPRRRTAGHTHGCLPHCRVWLLAGCSLLLPRTSSGPTWTRGRVQAHI